MGVRLFDQKFGVDLVRELPRAPGVYLFRDVEGRVLYAGKAKDLRRRLAGYRTAPRRKTHRRMRTLVREAASLEVRPQESEKQALLLENLLWFPEFFTRVLPGPLLNVATVIHSDEALLAVGFIFTIHFFNTHFRPEKFPMDTVIFTGTIPLDEFKQGRPREYAELVRTGALEGRLTSPPDPKVVRQWRIFGSIALLIGIALIVLIIYTAIFGYR